MRKNSTNQRPGNRSDPRLTPLYLKTWLWGPLWLSRVWDGVNRAVADSFHSWAWEMLSDTLTFMGRQPERGKLERWRGHKSQAVVTSVWPFAPFYLSPCGFNVIPLTPPLSGQMLILLLLSSWLLEADLIPSCPQIIGPSQDWAPQRLTDGAALELN